MTYGLSNEVLARILAVFAQFPQVQEVVLYGSRAKGTHKPGSDIDLTVKGDALSLQLLNRIALALDDLLLPYNIDLSLHHQISNPDLLAHIERVGQVIYHRPYAQNAAANRLPHAND